MKGKLVILAGGISSRMKNSVSEQLTPDHKLFADSESKPKSMIRVGKDDRPFLDYLLFNAREVGYYDVVIVISENDDSIKKYYGSKNRDNEFKGLNISYAVQPIPAGREKPLGTGDALLYALKIKPEWKRKSFTVCNSDNLYSQSALLLMRVSPYPNAMIDYDRSGLRFESDRIEKFAITKKDAHGFLTDIIEKPSKKIIESSQGHDGFVGISMNIFRFRYEMIFPYLETMPISPVRKEKELPTAIKMMIDQNPNSLFTYPLREHVPDLTSKTDILEVQDYLNKYFPNFSF